MIILKSLRRERILKINDLIIYNGPNIYSHKPCIMAKIDIGKYCNIPTCDIPNFNNLLLEYIPTLKEHKCSEGYRGGFVDRLYEGTFLAHVFEHVCIEIQNILGYDISFGKARQTEEEHIYRIIFEFENKIVAEEVLYLAMDLINDLCRGYKNIKFQEKINKLRKMAISQNLGPSTQAIVSEAKLRNIPIIHIEGSLLQLGYGCFGKRLQATITENTGCIPVDIACDKKITKELLTMAGIPVPYGYVSDNLEDILNYTKRIGYPVVIKPNHGNQGKGVSLNLTDKDHISTAFKIAKEFCDQVVVEKYIQGNHYRILVVDGEYIACAQRIAAHVVGNGKNNIEELIRLENQNPLRGEEHEKPLTKLKIDPVMELLLKKNNMDLKMIPAKGEVVFLRENDNLSTGGIALDVTDKVHPQNIEMAINAANVIGLDIAGIDITTVDISSPMTMEGGAVIEVNAAPGIRMHHYPTQGKQRNVARKILDSLFPKGQPCTIPIISITGTNGKTTTSRMLGKILKEEGLKVGMTTTGGIFIDQKCIMKGDTTGALSAQSVLMNKKVAELGLENSSFRNPHGLDQDGHYSTASDLAAIAAKALENELFREIVSTKSKVVAGRSLTNHNRLLWSYKGAQGVKTGYTMAAGRTLVSCAERDGLRLICVTLCAPDDWDDHMKLYDWAFSQYKMNTVAEKNQEYCRVPVISGVSDSVAVGFSEDCRLLLAADDVLETKIRLPKFVYAPVPEDDIAGGLEIIVNGELIKTLPLTYMETVEQDEEVKLSLWGRIKHWWYLGNSQGIQYRMLPY